MKTIFICIGKTNERYWQDAMNEYLKRLQRYSPFEIIEMPNLRNTHSITEQQIKHAEGENLLRLLNAEDFVTLLDDKGRQYTSLQFAEWYQQRMMAGTKRLVFVVGGAYGFSRDVYERANGTLSLSRLTFSHQLVRPIFLEQLYRAQTILHNEPYHHE